MPDLMTVSVPDIPAARAGRVWSQVFETASGEQARSSRRRAIGLSAGATSLAGVLGFALVTPTSSFASWTEVPTPIQVSLADAAVRSCVAALPSGSEEMVGRSAPRSLLGERRGDFTTVLLAGADNISVCIAGTDLLVSARTRATALPGNEVLSMPANSGWIDGDGPRYVYGQVADQVRGVTVVTDDGVRVAASVHDGYFVAWWPGPAAPTTVTATGEDGEVLTALTPSGG